MLVRRKEEDEKKRLRGDVTSGQDGERGLLKRSAGGYQRGGGGSGSGGAAFMKLHSGHPYPDICYQREREILDRLRSLTHAKAVART